MLHLLLASALSLPSTVVVQLRPAPEANTRSEIAAPAALTELACDDATNGGTVVERSEAFYGNRFRLECGGGRIVGVRFTHFGYGLPGPYAYRLHLLDAACREIAVSPVLQTPGAPDAATTVAVDLSSVRWCVGPAFSLLLEPLSCADGVTAHDCFPALLVDASSDGEAGKHCAIVEAPTGDGRQCLAARSADGRYFDFRLRVQVQCAAPECISAVQLGTWGGVKRLYRDPAPQTRD